MVGLLRSIRSLAYGATHHIRNLSLALVFATGAVQAQTVKIVALGDSLTRGYGLPREAGLVPQLEAWLHVRGADVALINAGVSGDTTKGGLARVNWTLTPDVDAMILTLGGNDMLRGIDPAAVKENLTGILQAARDANVAVLLAGIKAPGNFGPDYKHDFDAIYPDLAREFGVLYHVRFLGPIAEAIAKGTKVEDLMQADRLHPNAAGVALIVEALGPRVLELIARVR